MNLTDVKAFIKLAREEGVSELKYEKDGIKFAVAFNTHSAVSLPVSQPIVSLSSPSNDKKNVKVTDGHQITSPFVGTFYASPSPDKPVYVKLGDKIRKGQVLCILEAMKIMNEIESDCDGELVEICVDNESLVEYAQPLFRIRTK